MSFTQAYGKILLPFVENYKSTKNKKAQKGVMETATKPFWTVKIYWKSKGWIFLKI